MRPLSQTSPKELALLACPFGAQITSVKPHVDANTRAGLPAGLNKRKNDLKDALKKTPCRTGEDAASWLARAFPNSGDARRDVERAWAYGSPYVLYSKMQANRFAEICFEYGEFARKTLSDQALAAIGGALNTLTQPGVMAGQPLYNLVKGMTNDERLIIYEAVKVLWGKNPVPEDEARMLSVELKSHYPGLSPKPQPKPQMPKAAAPVEEPLVAKPVVAIRKTVAPERVIALNELMNLQEYERAKDYAWNWNFMLGRISTLNNALGTLTRERNEALQRVDDMVATRKCEVQAIESATQLATDAADLLAGANRQYEGNQELLKETLAEYELDLAEEQAAHNITASKAAKFRAMLEEALTMIEI